MIEESEVFLQTLYCYKDRCIGQMYISYPQDMEKRDAVNAKKMWSHDAKPGDLVMSFLILEVGNLLTYTK
jgi:hypothetical protein